MQAPNVTAGASTGKKLIKGKNISYDGRYASTLDYFPKLLFSATLAGSLAGADATAPCGTHA